MASDGRRLRGLVAATFTPMNLNCEINLSIIQQYVDYLVDKQKVKNIFVNGTTGEGMSLSVQERKRLAEEWVRHARGKMDNVIVHVGCLSLEDSKDLASHAASCGADAIAAVSPSFIKPTCPDALVMYLKEVASAAPSLPFYYYHIPSLTGVTYRVNDLAGRMKVHIPSFRGVKFSDMNLFDFSMCVHEYKEYDFLYGVDEQLLGALVFGAHGAVGSTYNYLGATTHKILTAFLEGDLEKARKIQCHIQEFMTFVFALGWGLPEFKNIMSEVSGINLGPPRLPLMSSFKPEHPGKVREEMKRLGFIEESPETNDHITKGVKSAR
ncbi:N-acetylneuraminate lyase [Leptodactylus fuscus]|uniref:N-acetylneuraminate lyase n=1 Tax=Leptodactylus fuscus TaxID=238119 RepID=UPI003F4E97A1